MPFLESDPNTPTTSALKSVAQEALKPHEKRALNFLVNEYLLSNSYKLTSITLSDENDDQVTIFLQCIYFNSMYFFVNIHKI